VINPGRERTARAPDADDESVVGKMTGVSGDGYAPLGLDRGECITNEAHVLVVRKALELHAPRRGALKRFEHGQRAVLEAGFAAEQVDAQIGFAEEGAQRKARLEADAAAAAGDEDTGSLGLWHGSMLASRARERIGDSALRHP
jgi:hypothetical protein